MICISSTVNTEPSIFQRGGLTRRVQTEKKTTHESKRYLKTINKTLINIKAAKRRDGVGRKAGARQFIQFVRRDAACARDNRLAHVTFARRVQGKGSLEFRFSPFRLSSTAVSFGVLASTSGTGLLNGAFQAGARAPCVLFYYFLYVLLIVYTVTS